MGAQGEPVSKTANLIAKTGAAEDVVATVAAVAEPVTPSPTATRNIEL